MVKKFRTTLRNRQTRIVTSSYMELDMVYKIITKSSEVQKKVPYIDSLRNVIQVLDAEYHDKMDEVAAAKDVEYAEVVDEEDEVEDAEYILDVPDEGRNALFDLLIAASERCDKR